jgi:hypothetical protein
MRCVKPLFLMFFLIGIPFTLRMCTVARLQSGFEYPVVSQKITTVSEAADDHTRQKVLTVERKQTIENQGQTLPAMDPVKINISDPVLPGFAVKYGKVDCPEPSIEPVADQSGDTAESASTTEALLESDLMAQNSIKSKRVEGKHGAEVEVGIRIVQITVPEESAEDLEIEIIPDSTREAYAFAGGFHLAGNVEDNPYCLMVRTRDKTGTEIVQYLPWNQNDPNAYHPHSPLYGYASIAVYESQKLIGRFYVTDFTEEKLIPLDLDLCRLRQMAGL